MSNPHVIRLDDGKSTILDLLRFLAAQLVLWVHILEWTAAPSLPKGRLDFMIPVGYFAVMCFFVLSGLLIARSIITSATAGNGHDFRNYLAQRIARLWPTLLVSLAVTLAAFLLIKQLDLFGSSPYSIPDHEGAFPRKDAHLKASTFLATALFMNGMVGVEGYNVGTVGMNGPLWSLAHEFWFYVLAGLLASWAYNRSRLALTAAAAILAWQSIMPNERWLLGLAVWSMGAAGALFLAGKKTKPGMGIALACAGIAIVAWRALGADSAELSAGPRLALGLAGVLVVAGALRSAPQFSQNAARRVSTLAAYTFTLYAIHWPLIQLFIGFSGAEFHALPATTAALSMCGLAAAINLIAFYLAKFCEDTPRWRRVFAVRLNTTTNP